MTISNERCSTSATRSLTTSDTADENRSTEHHRFRATPVPRRILVPDGGQVVAVDEPMSQRLKLESADFLRLAALLRRACGPSVIGAVMGRARLQDELERHLACSALMAKRLVDTMIGRGLIRQEVHRDGWVHWVVSG